MCAKLSAEIAWLDVKNRVSCVTFLCHCVSLPCEEKGIVGYENDARRKSGLIRGWRGGVQSRKLEGKTNEKETPLMNK